MDILLVEDNSTDLELALRVFRREKITDKVHAVRDGQEALDYLMQSGGILPRLVVLDLKMPRIGGIEVLRRLRQHQRTRHLPVVVLSSSTEPRDIQESRRAGADSYVVKPVDFAEYTSTVALIGRYWLRSNRFIH